MYKSAQEESTIAMNHHREPSRASERFRKIEILDRTGKKVRFAVCGHKDRTGAVINFWGHKHTIPLSPEMSCITCRQNSGDLDKVKPCSKCGQPRLENFKIEHDCPKASKPNTAASTPAEISTSIPSPVVQPIS